MPLAVCRLGAVLDVPDLAGYQRIYWAVGVNLPDGSRNIPRLLFAVAEIEEQYPFARVIDFAIRPDPEDPRCRAATVNIAVLVPK